jgi:TRAP transporter TAXI family solute receptor
MKKVVAAFCMVIILVGVFSADSLAVELAIMTGGPKGTYYQFGLNLEDLAKTTGITLQVNQSTGSIENLYAVYRRPNTQMGIVQSDVLAFVARVQTDPVLKRIAKKTRMIFPLYNEEVHLLGRREMSDFDDLAGKRVAIGKEGSGTYLTARLLFEVSEIRPREMIPIGTSEALSQLKSGGIDAMFYVAGYPVKLFADDVLEGDELTLLSISNKSIIEFYPQAKIPANTYPWQQKTVNTVAVKAVLVSFNFRRANCEYVGEFSKNIYENMDWLIQNGHSKWKSVDLDYPLKGWEQYDCVKSRLQKTRYIRRSPAEVNPILEAVRDILGPE